METKISGESTSETATSDTELNPRNKHAWLQEAKRIFGPDTDLVRVSSSDRFGRFLVAKTSRRFDGRGGIDVVCLGSGDSWGSACMRATQSDLGRGAIAENARAIKLALKAQECKTPGEFADHVMSVTIEEAKANGASEAELDALKSKFEEARKLINDDHSKQSAGAVPEGSDDSSCRDDHEGA